MDDYSVQSLSESKNEWCARLVNIFTPLVNSGFQSIFNESWKLCEDNDEEDKYLMTYQNFLSRIPKWNASIIEEEKKRIVENSGCDYLEELITCVHIIQLKALTCVRVGQKQKKIDIDIPSLTDFVHKIYISTARKLYTNVYLFEKNIMPLQIQKHNREIETIIRECIMETIRESIPVEKVLRVYMDESEEHDVETHHEEEIIPVADDEKTEDTKDTKEATIKREKDAGETADNVTLKVESKKDDTEEKESNNQESNNQETNNQETNNQETKETTISFTSNDNTFDESGKEEVINAPKTIQRLEEISTMNHEKRKLEEEEEEEGGEGEEEKINIGTEIKLDNLDIHDIDKPLKTIPDPILNDIEILT
jgi:hypothetical protein